MQGQSRQGAHTRDHQAGALFAPSDPSATLSPCGDLGCRAQRGLPKCPALCPGPWGTLPPGLWDQSGRGTNDRSQRTQAPRHGGTGVPEQGSGPLCARPALRSSGLSPRRPGEEDTYLWSRTPRAPRPDSKQVLLHFLLQERTEPPPAGALGQSRVNPIWQTNCEPAQASLCRAGELFKFFFLMEIKST